MNSEAVLNDKWSKEFVHLFNKLNGLGDDWKRCDPDDEASEDGSRLFISLVRDEPWKLFQHAFFRSPKLKCLKAVVHFGLYTSDFAGYEGSVTTQL